MSTSSRPPRFFPHANDAPAAGPLDLAEARALYAQLDPAWFDEANDPHAWLFEPAMQALIAEVVEDAVAPWVGRLPAEALEAMREEIELACHTDATLIAYLDRLRPRADKKQSGKTTKGLFTPRDGSPAASRKKAGGGQP